MADAGPNRIARAEPKPPAPVLQSWHCTRGHKLALLALAPGSRVSVYCRKCGCWYEKEMAPAPVGPTLDKA
jgi:hypothetical protein